MMHTLHNQRRHERFAADVPVRITIPGRFEAFARTRDLSFGGAFVACPFQFKSAPDVVVELRLPDETVPVKGRVVRKVDGGFAIAFAEMKPKAREAVLRHFVPAEHRAFHKDLGMKQLPVEQLSLILHAWDEWKQSA